MNKEELLKNREIVFKITNRLLCSFFNNDDISDIDIFLSDIAGDLCAVLWSNIYLLDEEGEKLIESKMNFYLRGINHVNFDGKDEWIINTSKKISMIYYNYYKKYLEK